VTRRRDRPLCVAAVAIEAVAIPVYGAVFGAALAGLLVVRALLALVLAVLAWRGAEAARAVLASLRLLSGLVAIGMATVARDGMIPLLALGAVDAGLGVALFLAVPVPPD